jgi:hypothetical protein
MAATLRGLGRAAAMQPWRSGMLREQRGRLLGIANSIVGSDRNLFLRFARISY